MRNNFSNQPYSAENLTIFVEILLPYANYSRRPH